MSTGSRPRLSVCKGASRTPPRFSNPYCLTHSPPETTRNIIPFGDKVGDSSLLQGARELVDRRFGDGDGMLSVNDFQSQYAFYNGVAVANQHGAVGAGTAFLWCFLTSV